MFARARALAARWMLPERVDARPDYELGRAPVGLEFGIRSYTTNRGAIALYAVGLHAILWLASGRGAWLAIAGLSLIHAVAIVPLAPKLGLSQFHTALTDLLAIAAAAALLGDPSPSVFWFPTVMVGGLLYAPSRDAIRVAGASALALAALYVGMAVGLPSNPVTSAEFRLYAFLAMGCWLLTVVLYAYSIGAALNRGDLLLNDTRMARAQAEAEATTRLGQIDSILGTAPIGIALQDGEGVLRFANRRASEAFDVDLDDFVDANLATFLLPDDRMDLERARLDAIEQDTPTRLQYTSLSGKTIVHRMGRIRLEDGSDGVVSTLQDITEIHESTARLRRFSTALETTPDLVVVWNHLGEILHTNRSFRRFWELKPMGTAALLEPTLGAHFARALEHAAASGEVINEITVTTPDGELVPLSVTVQTSADTDTGDLIHAAAARDVRELVETKRALQDNLDSKNEFIASVSHELRTPLTAVVGFAAELAQASGSLTSAEANELAHVIAEQASDVAAIVEDLLIAARAESGMLTILSEPVDVAEQVTEALQSLPRDFASSIEVDLQRTQLALGDSGRVRQIVRNLLTNAKRYGGPQVAVTVRTSESGLILVSVTDNGEAIPEPKRVEIFEAYGRAHKVKGTPDSVGLGLTVSRSLARFMGGDITYDHTEGCSVFTLALPAFAESEAGAA